MRFNARREKRRWSSQCRSAVRLNAAPDKKRNVQEVRPRR